MKYRGISALDGVLCAYSLLLKGYILFGRTIDWTYLGLFCYGMIDMGCGKGC
jgi:hypothetical protein